MSFHVLSVSTPGTALSLGGASSRIELALGDGESGQPNVRRCGEPVERGEPGTSPRTSWARDEYE